MTERKQHQNPMHFVGMEWHREGKSAERSMATRGMTFSDPSREATEELVSSAYSLGYAHGLAHAKRLPLRKLNLDRLSRVSDLLAIAVDRGDLSEDDVRDIVRFVTSIAEEQEVEYEVGREVGRSLFTAYSSV
ncbi:MAG: hypothetical protein AAF916_10895 [Planctomycetota bacterium]